MFEKPVKPYPFTNTMPKRRQSDPHMSGYEGNDDHEHAVRASSLPSVAPSPFTRRDPDPDWEFVHKFEIATENIASIPFDGNPSFVVRFLTVTGEIVHVSIDKANQYMAETGARAISVGQLTLQKADDLKNVVYTAYIENEEDIHAVLNGSMETLQRLVDNGLWISEIIIGYISKKYVNNKEAVKEAIYNVSIWIGKKCAKIAWFAGTRGLMGLGYVGGAIARITIGGVVYTFTPAVDGAQARFREIDEHIATKWGGMSSR